MAIIFLCSEAGLPCSGRIEKCWHSSLLGSELSMLSSFQAFLRSFCPLSCSTRMLRSRMLQPQTLWTSSLSFRSSLPRQCSSRQFNIGVSKVHSEARGIHPAASKSVPQHSNRGDVLILGIETSCDDTGAAVVTGNGEILSEVISSQQELLAQYGGVFPKMAQEGHVKAIDKVVADALSSAHVRESDLSAIAVTIGPGLSLCLSVGARKARSIARIYRLPWIGVHHMEAHALVARLTDRTLKFPFLVLLVSGGHNLLLLAQDIGDYIQLGTTIDDAIGEAYDKTARMLGLDLTKGGGPALEELALEGDSRAVNFSVPMRSHRDCNFSYAGLKTQVRLAIESRTINPEFVPIAAANSEERQIRANIAASFQRVAVLHLEDKCSRGIEWAKSMSPSLRSLVVSGGVASNKVVRERLGELAEKHMLSLVCPPPRLCTDNGVMVAWAGVEHFQLGRSKLPPPVDEPEDVYLDLRPRWQLGEIYAEGLSNARSLKRAHSHPSLTAEVRRGL